MMWKPVFLGPAFLYVTVSLTTGAWGFLAAIFGFGYLAVILALTAMVWMYEDR